MRWSPPYSTRDPTTGSPSEAEALVHDDIVITASLRSLLRPKPRQLTFSFTVTDSQYSGSSPGWTSLTPRLFANYADHDYDPAQVHELYPTQSVAAC